MTDAQEKKVADLLAQAEKATDAGQGRYALSLLKKADRILLKDGVASELFVENTHGA